MSIKPLPPYLTRLKSLTNQEENTLYCVTHYPEKQIHKVIYRVSFEYSSNSRCWFIRLRSLDYPTARTKTAVKGAKRKVYPCLYIQGMLSIDIFPKSYFPCTMSCNLLSTRNFFFRGSPSARYIIRLSKSNTELQTVSKSGSSSY